MMDSKSSVATGNGGKRNNSSSWVVSIEDAIQAEIREFFPTALELRTTKCAIFRVPKRVKNRLGQNDMTYVPDGISLGLYHRPGRYEAPTRGEGFKLKLATAFLATIFMREERCRKSLARLATNPTFQQQVLHLDGRVQSNRVDEATEFRSMSETKTTTDYSRSNSEPDAGGVRLTSTSMETKSVEVITLSLKDHAWRDLCHEVVGDVRLTTQLYHLQNEDKVTDEESLEEIKCALTLDAIGLAIGLGLFFLGRGHELFPFPLFEKHLERGGDGSGRHAAFQFYLDFLKLENQIPLRLLRRVLRVLHDDHNEHIEQPIGGGKESNTKGDAFLSEICAQFANEFCRKYVPGYDACLTKAYIGELREKGMFIKCHHLLDCISLVLLVEPDQSLVEEQRNCSHSGRVTSSGLKLPRWMAAKYVGDLLGCLSSRAVLDDDRRSQHSRPHPFNSARGAIPRSAGSVTSRNVLIPSATRLHEAGIDLRSRASVDNCDLLPVFKPGWFKATLYIPRLPRLENLTLTAWRNLLAYEARVLHSDRGKESQLLAIIAFIGCLIDTKEDVQLMTRGRNPVLPDRHGCAAEDLAQTLSTLLIGLPVPEYQRWMALQRQIVNYHNQICRRLVLDFMRANFGKPWLIISVVAASVLLVLTFLQTVYTILTYYP